MAAIRRLVIELAPSPSTVLVTGETGTGKSLVARALHEASPRRSHPFAVVDCASLAPTLVESELFGHEAGAFTGAQGRRSGRLESAGRGTLFLDEIGELPSSLQARLLRALEDRVFEPLGASRSQRLEARLVAASHVDLASAVRERRFRADLFYRLDVGRMELPPLRQRMEDLPELVEHLLAGLSRRLGREPPRPEPDLLAALGRHDWPGNVRELRNVLERMLLRSRSDRLGARQLNESWQGSTRDALPKASSAPVYAEREWIASALRASGGNISRAARRLGLARTSLRRRIQKYGLADLVPRD